MEALSAYVIPVTALRSGRNELDFKADWRFFLHFEGSPIQQGSFEIGILFDKYPDNWHLHFEVKGHVDTECDRCLAPISLPVQGSYELYVKFDEDAKNEEKSAEVIYLPKETTQMNVAQLIYEFIVLSLPVNKVYDCQSETKPPCDFEMLDRLKIQEGDAKENATWDILKQIQLNKGKQ
jgi:uncharacterized metal-binding protein YceD (DUF177 family)